MQHVLRLLWHCRQTLSPEQFLSGARRLPQAQFAGGIRPLV
jgi:hypothetical protein